VTSPTVGHCGELGGTVCGNSERSACLAEIRHWTQERAKDRKSLPSPKVIPRQLGWDLIEMARITLKAPDMDKVNYWIGKAIRLDLVPHGVE
jgi:hypothetical protein